MNSITESSRAGIVYEVQILTVCNGWVNTWHYITEDGQEIPETFPTAKAARAALQEFLDEIAEEIRIGIREPDCGYDRGEFRVVPVANC